MLTENEVDGTSARMLRMKLGLSQSRFWSPLGVAQSVGARYELKNMKIPAPVRKLIVLRHVAGFEPDTATPEGVEEIGTLARAMMSRRAAREQSLQARSAVRNAIKNLERAEGALENI